MLNFQNTYQNRLLLLALLLHNYVKCYIKGGKTTKCTANSKEAASIAKQTLIDEDFARHVCDVLVSYGISNSDSSAEWLEPMDCSFDRKDSLYMVRSMEIKAQHISVLKIAIICILLFVCMYLIQH